MKYSFLAFSVLFFLSACAQNKVDNNTRTIVFDGVNVIPMDRETILANHVVVVTDGRIAEIGEKGKVKYPSDAMVIEGKGKYLIPGLAEMHAHVPPVDDIAPMKETLRLFALHGITTIRGMLGHPLHLELRKQLQNGEIQGPRFYTSGPSFNGSSVKTPEDGAKMVRDQHSAGYDFLKLHPGLVPETFKAIAETADEL